MNAVKQLEYYREALSNQGDSIVNLDKLIDKVSGMNARLAEGERRRLVARRERMISHYNWLEQQIQNLELNECR